ncbi:D-alanyl-D-alanine carboxypeptidase [Paenibacillus albiflavus]|uniref:serine-type D-Ala-D-Ala carboxypeptidase n=1 Tax=Paenibacillus albiflavus TaxID=2545760 RepID=A0A4R4E0F9_9BACL|nr:D-alanyl-D-alanine carboxypeptidase family protein [Paenibacillus albiflavus]TCZ72849.1 D-alanyl-D-alanine carboxypeptidase [Paenibacillus albiflavus]
MKRWKKSIASVLLIGMLQLAFFHINISSVYAEGENQTPAASTSGAPKLDTAKAAILIDAATGQVLYEFNADEAREPASMTKMMSEYLVLEAISAGKFTWDQPITTTKYAAHVPGSGQMVAEGEKLPLKDMFALMSIYSGNDGTLSLAEAVGGSEEGFVDMMNAKAKEIGMSDKTFFNNATGLNHSDLGEFASPKYTGENQMTARDTATLARRLITDHPEILKYASVTSQKLRPTDKAPMINFNYMLEGFKDSVSLKQFAYQGLDGLKTGFTTTAGYCFTGTAERNGMRLISVVMGTDKINQRFIETAKLMDYGFNNFEFKKLVDAKSAVAELKTVEVSKGVELEVPVVTKNGVEFMVKKGESPSLDVKVEQIAEDKRVAPLKRGDKLGTATYTYKSASGDITQTVDLVAAEDVEKASWWRMILRSIKNFFGGLFDSIVNLF